MSLLRSNAHEVAEKLTQLHEAKKPMQLQYHLIDISATVDELENRDHEGADLTVTIVQRNVIYCELIEYLGFVHFVIDDLWEMLVDGDVYHVRIDAVTCHHDIAASADTPRWADHDWVESLKLQQGDLLVRASLVGAWG